MNAITTTGAARAPNDAQKLEAARLSREWACTQSAVVAGL